jgi:hypothetical protein
MEKRFGQAVSLVLAILLCLSAAPSLAQVPAQAPSRHCLWKVSSKDCHVYLLGSIHLLKRSAYPLDKALEAAFDDSATLALEVSLDEMNSPSSQRLMLSKGLLPGGKTLQQTLSEKTFAQVTARVETLGLKIEAVQRLKPWFLMLTLAVAKLQQLGYDPAHGVDKYFFDKAKQSNKTVLGLETAEFQINVLDRLSDKTQEAALLQTLADLDIMEKEFGQIVQAWAAGDTKGLEESLLESFNGYPEVYEKIVSERNRNWIPKIEEFLRQQGNTLVVVGAAHLLGSAGVVELLKQKGYAIEQQ